MRCEHSYTDVEVHNVYLYFKQQFVGVSKVASFFMQKILSLHRGERKIVSEQFGNIEVQSWKSATALTVCILVWTTDLV